jgi:hypothetical protein
MKFRFWLTLACLPTLALAANPDPTQLIKKAFDNWRGKSSFTEISMTVHRPDWERTLAMHSWTRGDDDASPSRPRMLATPRLNLAMRCGFSIRA